ncbi:uncharacterized protein [Haliotis cracherodii]|uniref:uncharacterized protein n=1 Tax=Haliotis cracherodii TaxID=6455 RepID=UPI0039E930B3
MANMVGDWILVPELTTGHDEFSKAMGMSDAEREATRHLVYTFHLSRDGDEWYMKVVTETGVVFVDTKFRMDVPFTYSDLDKTATLTSLISLRNDHFIEKMTQDKNGVVMHWDVDTYRDGDFVITAQTKDGATETQRLRKR